MPPLLQVVGSHWLSPEPRKHDIEFFFKHLTPSQCSVAINSAPKHSSEKLSKGKTSSNTAAGASRLRRKIKMVKNLRPDTQENMETEDKDAIHKSFNALT